LSYRRYSKSERAALVADMLDRFQIVGKRIYTAPAFRRPTTAGRVARAIIAEPNFCSPMNHGKLHSSQGEESWSSFAAQ